MNKKHKIPLKLKVKRFKNSPFSENLNSIFSIFKPSRSLKEIPKRILIIRNDRIGDAVVTIPVINEMKSKYPQLIIDILASSYNEFVFKECKAINNIITLNTGFKLGLGILFRNSDSGKLLRVLKANKYDAVIDLVGKRNNLLLGKYLTKFTAGPRLTGAYFFYSYYSASNWVTAKDTDSMTNKIRSFINEAMGMNLSGEPDNNIQLLKKIDSDYDIIFHIGTSPLRKFPQKKEEELIECFKSKRLLVTDSHESAAFIELKNKYGNSGIRFKLFQSLPELAGVCKKSNLLLCYDGGQAHYLSKYIRTIVIFGPGSEALWKPYEYSEYILIEEDINKAKAVMSSGKLKHIAIYCPIWCRPCFDIGCKERPCLTELDTGFICKVINNYCFP